MAGHGLPPPELMNKPESADWALKCTMEELERICNGPYTTFESIGTRQGMRFVHIKDPAGGGCGTLSIIWPEDKEDTIIAEWSLEDGVVSLYRIWWDGDNPDQGEQDAKDQFLTIMRLYTGLDLQASDTDMALVVQAQKEIEAQEIQLQMEDKSC